MNPNTTCMGGFCHLREKCSHHHNEGRNSDPAERMCTPGAEREMFFVQKPEEASKPVAPGVTAGEAA